MSMSPATVAAHAREEKRSTRERIHHFCNQAVIAKNNLENWPQEEAQAALTYALAQLGKLVLVKYERPPFDDYVALLPDDDGGTFDPFGQGKTPEAALADFAEEVIGKWGEPQEQPK